MRSVVFALMVIACAAVRAQPYTLTSDVPYDAIEGVDPALLSLDVYRPAGAGPFPIVVFVHGGGWHSGDKVSAVHAKGDWLTSRGVMLVSVNYRLSPEPSASPAPDRITFPTHPEDVGRAVDFVRANAATWDGDPGRLALMGHSAGAHLATLVSTDASYTAGDAPGCVVSLDTNAYDVPFYLGSGPGPTVTATYTNAFTDDPAVQAEASPTSHLGDWPQVPVLVAHQTTAPRTATADRFLDALQAEGRDATRLATDLSHQEINTLLGTQAAPALTAAIEAFLDACLSAPTDAEAPPAQGAAEPSPNPATGRVRLALPAGGAPYRIRVVDARGRTVRVRLGVGADAELDVTALAPGVYGVVARGSAGVVRQTVTVAR